MLLLTYQYRFNFDILDDMIISVSNIIRNMRIYTHSRKAFVSYSLL